MQRGEEEGKVEEANLEHEHGVTNVAEEEKKLTSVIGQGERIILQNENYKDNGAGERSDPGLGGPVQPQEQRAVIVGAGGDIGGEKIDPSLGKKTTIKEGEKVEEEEAAASDTSSSAAASAAAHIIDVIMERVL